MVTVWIYRKEINSKYVRLDYDLSTEVTSYDILEDIAKENEVEVFDLLDLLSEYGHINEDLDTMKELGYIERWYLE